jgi:putative ABC transport system permease protein
VRKAAIRNFEDTLGETVVVYITFFVVFACLLAIGVSYNAARIALSERGRELATMRVIGFSTHETAYILLGEIALLTFLAMPLGCAFGFGLAFVMADVFTTELFRIPLFVSNSTYAWSMLVVLIATAAALAFVGRRVARLDLIAVLKTRE